MPVLMKHCGFRLVRISGIILGLNIGIVLVFECKLCCVFAVGGNHMMGPVGKARMACDYRSEYQP